VTSVGGIRFDVRVGTADIIRLGPAGRSPRWVKASDASSHDQGQGGDGVKVWVYINNSREVGDVDHLKIFASEDAAEKWLAENDPEGVA
jgi:hypothetical protein